jgi:hypothetical protein
MSDVPSAAPAAPVDAAPAADATQANPVEGQTPGQPGVPPVAAQQALEKKIKKLKLKVDGKDIEESFDPDDDEYLTRNLQMAKMGQKRAQEYASLQKQVTSFVEELKKNPRKVLSDPNLNIDLKKIAAELIEEEIENSKKSPEQLELEKARQELKDLKEQQDQQKKSQEQKDYQRLVEENIERYDTMIGDALDKGKLPQTPYTVKKMADYLMLAVNNKLDVSPYEIVDLVREEMQGDIKQMFEVLPEDVVENIVGKETIDRIRKKNLAKATKKPPTPVNAAVKDTGSDARAKTQPKTEKKSFKEFFGV